MPQNLLPHLKWLTSGDYQHVFYVDGKPRVADVKIFPDDATHPNGWGTVLVVGMRLGGIPISVDTAADGLAGNDGDGDTSDDRTFSSAYSIFDITNPEDPPVLLAEISLPDNSLTTVYPTFFKEKDIDPASDPNQWFLIFGSGPDNHVSAESSSTAKVYVLNLLELTMPISSILNATTVKFGDLDGVQDCTIDTSTGYTLLACDTGKPNSFMGDPVAVDWQLDYRDDAIYFGTVGDENSTSGTLYRFALDGREDSAHWREPFPLFDAGLPISAGPTVSVDDQGKHWVFFGTGRLWSQGDLAATESQALFGMKDAYDPAETGTYGVGSQLDGLDLYDATNINIINFMRGDVTVFDGSDDTTTMRVTWLQGNVGAGPYQDWQVDNFTSGGSGISNTANTLGAVNTLRSFQVEPPSVANVVGDDILTWTTGGRIINGPGSMTTFNQLEAAIDSDSWAGWVVDLVPIHGTVGVDPATRATTQSSLVGGPCSPRSISPARNLVMPKVSVAFMDSITKQGPPIPAGWYLACSMTWSIMPLPRPRLIWDAVLPPPLRYIRAAVRAAPPFQSLPSCPPVPLKGTRRSWSTVCGAAGYPGAAGRSAGKYPGGHCPVNNQVLYGIAVGKCRTRCSPSVHSSLLVRGMG